MPACRFLDYFTTCGQSVVLEMHHEKDLRSSANNRRSRMRLQVKKLQHRHDGWKRSRHHKPHAEQRDCGPDTYVDCDRQQLHVRLSHILGHDPQNHHLYDRTTAHDPTKFFRHRMQYGTLHGAGLRSYNWWDVRQWWR